MPDAQELLRFVIIGLGTGGAYALITQGLVLVYKGSGILNFAQGAFAMAGAYAFYEAQQNDLSPMVGLGIAIVVGGLIGLLSQLLILGPMRTASPLSRVIATLGLLITLQSAATLRWGVDSLRAESSLPNRPVELPLDIRIGEDRLLTFLIAVLLTMGLHVVYKRTAFGRATAAVAENPMAAATMGHSPDRIAALNWAAAGALSGAAGALLAPITYVQASQFVLLIIPALAAGLLARFGSFPLALAGSLVVGISESLTARYVRTPGWSGSVAFILVILVMIFRGRALPLRSHVLDRLPAVGTGHLRALPVAMSFGVMALLTLFVLPTNWLDAASVMLTWVVLCLSVVVITGYTGQLSLAQYVIAGVGALVGAQLFSAWDWPFPVALLGGVTVAMLAGVVVAIPSVRTRGINLAVVTFGFGVLIFNIVLNNGDYSNHSNGIDVSNPTLFGWEISGIRHPNRYAFVVVAAVFLLMLVVANVRRGAAGRRMLAVRANERAAASLGVSVYGAKLYGFALSSAIAAVGGVLYAFRNSVVLPEQFAVLASINVVGSTVVGGVGFLGGAFFGSTLLPGGLAAEGLRSHQGLDRFLPLVGGVMLLLILRNQQSGLYLVHKEGVEHLWHKIRRPKQNAQTGGTAELPSAPAIEPERVPARPLRVEGLSVRFGGVVAVNDVTLEVRPGEVHGLIGPNGAGNTTFVDAVTGFVKPSAGRVAIGDVEISRGSPQDRCSAGLTRSFQSLELFSDLSVRENLAVASDDGALGRYLTDLARPVRARLSDAAHAAVHEFALKDVLDLKPDELSFGQRKLVAVARALATEPSVLLLDEPAAGLDDQEAVELAASVRAVADRWGMAVLLIEHNIDVVLRTCDRVSVLVAGSLLCTGTPAEVTADDRVVEAYLGADESEVDPDLVGVLE